MVCDDSTRIEKLVTRFFFFFDVQFTGPFVRIAHDEVSVGHPEGIRKVLLAPNPKVFHAVRGWWLRGTILIFMMPVVTMVQAHGIPGLAISKPAVYY